MQAGYTALHLAAKGGHSNIAILLLDNKAYIDNIDKEVYRDNKHKQCPCIDSNATNRISCVSLSLSSSIIFQEEGRQRSHVINNKITGMLTINNEKARLGVYTGSNCS